MSCAGAKGVQAPARSSGAAYGSVMPRGRSAGPAWHAAACHCTSGLEGTGTTGAVEHARQPHVKQVAEQRSALLLPSRMRQAATASTTCQSQRPPCRKERQRDRETCTQHI